MASEDQEPGTVSSSSDGVPGMVPKAKEPTQEAGGAMGALRSTKPINDFDASKAQQPNSDLDDFSYPLSLNELDPPLYLSEGRDDQLGYEKGELGGEFDLYGELFHIFISYRVVTEGSERPGNRFARMLYDELHNMSRDVALGLSIPPEGCGIYPSFAREPPEYSVKNQQAKVYLDEICLQDGQKWQDGFIRGLSVSLVVVPVLSWTRDDNGSVGKLCRMTEENDHIDNVLLEIIVALELMQHPSSPVKSLLPIFVGQQGLLDSFPWQNLQRLPDHTSERTAARAAQILRVLGVAHGQIETMKRKTIRSIIGDLLSYQGVQLNKCDDETEAIRECCTRILSAVRKRIGVESSALSNFVSVNPSGHEVVDWMQENAIMTYLPIFAAHDLNSLELIARLDNQDRIELFKEHSRMFSLRGQRPQKGDLIRLNRAFDALARDVRAKPISQRLEYFTDTKGSIMTVMFCSNSAEMMFADTPGSRTLFISIFSAILATYCYWTYYDISLYLDEENRDPNNPTRYMPEWNTAYATDNTYHTFYALLITINISCLILYSSWLLLLIIGGRMLTIPAKILFITRGLVLNYCVISPLVNIFFWITIQDDCNSGLYTETSPWNMSVGGVWNGTIVEPPHCDRLSKYPTQFWNLQTVVNSCGPGFWIITSALYYRQEYAIASVCFVLGLLFVNALVVKGEIQMFGAIVVFGMLPTISVFWVVGKFKAMSLIKKDLQQYNMKWDAIKPPPQEAVDHPFKKLAKLIKEQNMVLEQNYRAFCSDLSLLERLDFSLKTHIGRYAKSRDGWKGRQVHDNIDRLFAHATLINVPFQALITSILAELPDHRNKERLKRGPVKRPQRTLEKVTRRFRRDASRLTDLVRCTCVMTTPEEMYTFVESLVNLSTLQADVERIDMPRHPDDFPDVDDMSTDRKRIFRICKITNRFDPDYDAGKSAGYRDVSINVEVGWEMEAGMVVFKPVNEWGDYHRHICEIQVHLQGFNLPLGEPTTGRHRRTYVSWRDALTK